MARKLTTNVPMCASNWGCSGLEKFEKGCSLAKWIVNCHSWVAWRLNGTIEAGVMS